MAKNEPVKKVTEVQIILTRNCNIRCGYCKIIKRGFEKELVLDEWKIGIKNLQNLGFKTIKFSGGEPTFKDWLPELIEYSTNNTDLKIAILSNGSFEDEYGKRLGRVGLMGLFGSVDGLEQIVSVGRDAERKAITGYRMLQKAENWGIPLRASNTVINRKNLEQIPNIVDKLSNEGIYVNLCPVIWTDDKRREYSQQIPGSLKFRQEDEGKINNVMIKLLQIKNDGALITAPDSYLINMSKYGINCNWRCSDFVQLRIDADGALMLCNDYRTELSEKYNIVNLDEKRYNKFIRDWHKVREEINCKGCYWSCFLQAEDNIEKCREEFHYFKKE